ncbi:MAG: hypothetical protein QMC67_11205 [Candidatus Wallbacteria bacterium]
MFNKVYGISICIVFLLTALFVLGIFARDPGFDWYGKALLTEMIHGYADKPFVSRALVPGIIKTIITLSPAELSVRLAAYTENNSALKNIFKSLKWKTENTFEYIVTLVVLYIFLLAFLAAFRKLLFSLFKINNYYADLLSFISLVMLPAFFCYYSYIYDFATLFLFTAAVFFMVSENWRYYLYAFIAACINKETSILLIAVFYFTFSRKKLVMADVKFRRLFLYQIIIYLTCRIVLFLMFINNDGPAIEFHFFDHTIAQIMKPYSISVIFTWLAIMALIFKNWDLKHSILKNWFLMFIPIFVMSFIFGYVDEIRVYYEIYPAALILLGQTLAGYLNIEMSPEFIK